MYKALPPLFGYDVIVPTWYSLVCHRNGMQFAGVEFYKSFFLLIFKYGWYIITLIFNWSFCSKLASYKAQHPTYVTVSIIRSQTLQSKFHEASLAAFYWVFSMESLLTPRPPDTQEQPVILYSVSTGTPAPGGLQIELLQKQVPRDQREADQGAQAGLQG